MSGGVEMESRIQEWHEEWPLQQSGAEAANGTEAAASVAVCAGQVVVIGAPPEEATDGDDSDTEDKHEDLHRPVLELDATPVEDAPVVVGDDFINGDLRQTAWTREVVSGCHLCQAWRVRVDESPGSGR